MATECEFEPSAAMLLVMRVGIQRIAEQAHASRLYDVARACDKYADELGRETRNRLREHGFEPHCEINMDMMMLAAKAQDAIAELGSYISANSPKVADFLAKHGNNSLQDWQDANPTPIRPERRKD